MRQELLYNDCFHFSPRGKELLLLKWSLCNMTVGNNVSWVKWVYGKLAIYRQYRGAIYILVWYPIYFLNGIFDTLRKYYKWYPSNIIVYLLIIKCLKIISKYATFLYHNICVLLPSLTVSKIRPVIVSRTTETMQSYPHTANPPWVTQMYNSTIILWSTHDNITVY